MNPVRSQEEILAQIKFEEEKNSFLNFASGDLVQFLSFENAKPHLKEGVTADEWHAPEKLDTLDAEAKTYLDFWLGKIEDERGISVCRATQHFIAWKWLLGHPDWKTFPGSHDGPDGGWYQRDAYDYIKQQVDSGEWDRLNAEAQQRACAPAGHDGGA